MGISVLSRFKRHQNGHIISFILIILLGYILSTQANVYRADDYLPQGLAKVSKEMVSQSILSAASKLKSGDVLVLSQKNLFNTVKMPNLPKNIQIIGGVGETMYLTGDVKSVLFFGSEYNIDTKLYKARLSEGSFKIQTRSVIGMSDADSVYIISNIGVIAVNGKWKNVTGVWIRYNSEAQRDPNASMNLNLQGTGQNCKILHAIEMNQGNQKPALLLENADGFALANGSTESTSSYDGRPIYEIRNSKNVYLGHRRFFSGRGPYPKTDTTWRNKAFFDGCRTIPSCWEKWHEANLWMTNCLNANKLNSKNCWKGWPTRSLKVIGGSNNILDNIVDLGNALKYSFELYEPDLQLWSLIGEAELLLPEDKKSIPMLSVTPLCGITRDYSRAVFVEPRDISKEVPFGMYANNQFYDLSKPGTTIPASVSWPIPPTYPKCDIPKAPSLLYKRAANFGLELIKAGADPKGIKASDEAFSKVAQDFGIIEIPAGTFRLDKGIVIPSNLKSKQLLIMGSGEGTTKLVGEGQAYTYQNSILSKSSVESIVYSDLTFDGLKVNEFGKLFDGGGTQDYAKTNISTDDIYHNCTFQNYKIAALVNNSGETEQYRFISCKFINTGEYGIRLNAYVDKPLFYRCYFKGQTKGGLYCTRIVHFHGGVYQCTFDSIGGPAIKIGGGNMTVGYGPWVFTVDNCTFNECGNSTEAIVDFGYSWEAVLANSTFKTSKPVFGAFKGNFAILENLDINVNAPTSLHLGHQRYETTAGVGNARLKNINANGQIKFLSRAEAMADDPGYPTNNQFYAKGGQLYDANEWAYTYLLYNVNSSNINENYALYKGKTKFLDLTSMSSVLTPYGAGAKLNLKDKKIVMYNLSGRLIAKIDANKPLPKKLTNNLLIIHDQNSKQIKRRVLLTNQK